MPTRDERNNITEAWKLYERGRSYNNRLSPNQYKVVSINTEFFIGNQWRGLPKTRAMRQLEPAVFNILKRVASLFVASLTSTGTTIRVDPLAYYDGSGTENPGGSVATFANAELSNLIEKFKLDFRIKDALFDGVQTGDYCAHFWFDPDAMPYGGGLANGKYSAYRGEIRMELVDGINVMFGNPNDRRVEEQPYILVVGRDTVDNLRAEAERFKKVKAIYASGTANKYTGDTLKNSFKPDGETHDFVGVGGKTELDAMEDGSGKALYVYLYTKVTKEETLVDENGETVYEDVFDDEGYPVYEEGDDGKLVMDLFGMPIPKRKEVKVMRTSVHVTKATRDAVIYEDVDTGLTRYPIAWGNWEKQKNQYHGRALVTGLIPNQIFINRMFAMGMKHLQLMAFPRTVYNADLISAWTDEVGQAIAVHGLQVNQRIPDMAANLSLPDMSAQVFAMIDKVMAYTKECLGATDVQMGNVRPDNTSAIMVLQTNSEVPLENIRSGLYEWVEDIGAILLDMMGTYYGERPVVVKKEFEEPVTGPDGMPQIDPNTGMMQTRKIIRKTLEMFDFNKFKNIDLDLRIDVGATNYFSEIAMTQTLDNLRADGTLNAIQYLERIPDKLLPRKQELIDELRGAMEAGEQPYAAAGMAIPKPGTPVSMDLGADRPAQGGDLSEDKIVNNMPGRIAAGYQDMPQKAKNAAMRNAAMLPM